MIRNALMFFGILVGAFINTTSAIAGPATDALSGCMADNTSGKERKDLARWVFVGMAAHPEIQTFANVTDASRDTLDRTMAALVTRLITVDCRVQARQAMDREGGQAFETAFGIIGKLAMQELMTNPAVNSAYFRYTKYVDMKRMSEAFSGK